MLLRLLASVPSTTRQKSRDQPSFQEKKERKAKTVLLTLQEREILMDTICASAYRGEIVEMIAALKAKIRSNGNLTKVKKLLFTLVLGAVPFPAFGDHHREHAISFLNLMTVHLKQLDGATRLYVEDAATAACEYNGADQEIRTLITECVKFNNA